jgi:hypothetical protein
MKRKALFFLFLAAVILNGLISLQLYGASRDLKRNEVRMKGYRVLPLERIICRRIDEDFLEELSEADFVIVTESREIRGFVYQIISDLIPMKEGAWTFHEVGQPLGPGIDRKYLSEIPTGAIHYSWDPSPHDTFTELFSATEEQIQAGAPAPEVAIAEIKMRSISQ